MRVAFTQVLHVLSLFSCFALTSTGRPVMQLSLSLLSDVPGWADGRNLLREKRRVLHAAGARMPHYRCRRCGQERYVNISLSCTQWTHTQFEYQNKSVHLLDKIRNWPKCPLVYVMITFTVPIVVIVLVKCCSRHKEFRPVGGWLGRMLGEFAWIMKSVSPLTAGMMFQLRDED